MERLQGAQGIQQLNVAAMTFMLNSVAPSTLRQYSLHLKQYVDFCQLRNLTMFPLHQQTLVLFAAYLLLIWPSRYHIPVYKDIWGP